MENGQSTRIYIFYCTTGIDPAALEWGCRGEGDGLRFVPLPCSGKAETLYLTKAFESGADGVAVITCGPGECRYLEGNMRAWRRTRAVDKLLVEIGRGEGRIAVIQKGDRGLEPVIREVKYFRDRINKMAGRSEIAAMEEPAVQPEVAMR